MSEKQKIGKKKFLIKYGLLYALCLVLSLGVGFIAAAAMAENALWEIVWPVFGGITLLSLALGFLSASAVYRKYSK